MSLLESGGDMYHRVCVLSATLMAQRKFQKRSKYYMLDHDVILTFGPSEFKAQIAWMEDVRSFLRLSHVRELILGLL